MRNHLWLALVFVSFSIYGNAQQDQSTQNKVEKSYGVQVGLSLLENPFVLYPIVNFSYSRTVFIKGRHRLAIFPQAGAIVLTGIETKYLFSTSAQYKYVSKKRFEANLFLGVNYQLRRLAYHRYVFEEGELKQKGRFLHQMGPTCGINIGYKIIKRKSFSISPFWGISITKLNKNFKPSLFEGYKPSTTIGITFNK